MSSTTDACQLLSSMYDCEISHVFLVLSVPPQPWQRKNGGALHVTCVSVDEFVVSNGLSVWVPQVVHLQYHGL